MVSETKGRGMVVGQAWAVDWQAKTVVLRQETEAWSLDGRGS